MAACKAFMGKAMKNSNKKGHPTSLENIFYLLPEMVHIHCATRRY